MSEDYTYPPLKGGAITNVTSTARPERDLSFIVQQLRPSEIQAGDLIVLSTKMFLSPAEIKRLEKEMAIVLPPGANVLVCDGGVTIQAILRGRGDA